MNQIKYKITPSILDAFKWYKQSYKKDRLQEFLDKLNKKYVATIYADKGKAFEDIVNGSLNTGIRPPAEPIKALSFQFDGILLNKIVNKLQGAEQQIFTKAPLHTGYGVVELYGKIDYRVRNKTIDLKTTKEFKRGKYLENSQHMVYEYCLSKSGNPIEIFHYLITDFSGLYVDSYVYDPLDEAILVSKCEELIEFLETHKDKITNKKIFALDFK